MERFQAVVNKFREKGYKITPQRVAIFRSLENINRHPSAEELFEQIRAEHPTISLTTVYKTLETLVELGELKELYICKERVYFDPNKSSHHHLICEKCSRIIDIPGLGMPEPAPVQANTKFKITRFQVQFYGLCGYCKHEA